MLAVREDVAGRRPVDAREREAREAFLAALDRLAHPFDQRADRTHVTASAVVTGERGVLLHRHRRLGIWLQPGGHLDAGEAPWEAAAREAREETGLEVALVGAAPERPPLAHVDVHAGGRGHVHLDLRYLAVGPSSAPVPPAGESQAVGWFPWHRAVAMADPGLEGILRAVQPGVPRLRPARHGDARECAHVYLRSRRFALPTVPVVHDDADVRRWVADEVVGHAEVLVADLDGTVVGWMALSAAAVPDAGWIDQLYLDPAWVGRGVGARLLERATARFPGGLELWTFQANEAARRFYARHGFAEVELTDGRANEERAPDVRLRWPGG